jgi:NTP pyrophosphatase (non-canonical NTP hydrolase)
MLIKEVAEEIHQNAKDKGFWDGERNTGELLMLIVSECGEALEADRKSRYADVKAFIQRFDEIKMSMSNPTPEYINQVYKQLFEERIKDSFEDEISDAIIRLLDLAEGRGIDIVAHIRAKMDYNKSRERLHGKNY